MREEKERKPNERRNLRRSRSLRGREENKEGEPVRGKGKKRRKGKRKGKA